MIKSTTDYSIFKTHPSNRPINGSQVDALVFSISKNNKLFAHPIEVNKQMQVIDGQHRLKAAQRLNIPVFYVIDENAEDYDIILLNANQKGWKGEDYLNFYCTQAYPQYLALAAFLKENGLTLTEWKLLSYSLRGTSAVKKFKDGRMEFDREKSNLFLLVWDRHRQVCEFIKDRRSNGKFITTTNGFKRGLILFLARSDVDFEEFISKLELKIDTVGKRAGAGGHYQMFLDIYNYKRRNPIAYDDEVNTGIDKY